MPNGSMRFLRRKLGCACHPCKVVDYGEIPPELLEGLGSCSFGRRDQDWVSRRRHSTSQKPRSRQAKAPAKGDSVAAKEKAKKPGGHRGKPRGVPPQPRGAGGVPARRDHGREALRSRLHQLKERLIGDRRESREDVIEVMESEDGLDPSEDSDYAVEKKVRKTALRTGSNLNPAESRLALRDLDEPEDSKDSISRRSLRVKKEQGVKKKVPSRKSRRRRTSLLAVAEQREEESRKKRASIQRKKGKSRSSGAKALVDLLTGKRKKGKTRGGGSSPSSSGSSEDGDTEDEESSSESEVTAPLKKRSLKHPGSILKMLVSHAREALDQSAVVEMDSGSAVTGGMKMATYFNLLVRPNFNQGSRDLKEMHLLAICIDQLRSGQLKPLADSLSARFVALHCAAVEGSWTAAKHLELHPLEPVQSAPTEVLLRARKHAKLIQKSHGTDEGSYRSKGGGSWSSWNPGKAEEIGTMERAKERAQKERVEPKEREKEVAGSRTTGTAGTTRIEIGGRTRRMRRMARQRRRRIKRMVRKRRQWKREARL